MRRVIEQVKSRRKFLIASFIIGLVCYLLLEFVSARYIVAFTRQGHYCLPYSLWLIDKTKRPGRGDFACFVGRGIPNFADGIKWVKILSGMPGDRIETRVYPPGERDSHRTVIEVNGLPIPMRLQGVVYLNNMEFNVYEKDTKGRTLPMIAGQTIPPGRYYVHATSSRSFDSRYWGLVDEENMVGKATPLY